MEFGVGWGLCSGRFLEVPGFSKHKRLRGSGWKVAGSPFSSVVSGDTDLIALQRQMARRGVIGSDGSHHSITFILKKTQGGWGFLYFTGRETEVPRN